MVETTLYMIEVSLKNRKLKFEIFQGDRRGTAKKVTTLQEIELGPNSPTDDQIDEIVKYFWEYTDGESTKMIEKIRVGIS